MTINDWSSIVALGISLAAIIIAGLSWRTTVENADAKLRLDLFEKRFEQYDVISEILTYIYRTARVEPGAIARLHRTREYCRFLFDESISEYVFHLIGLASRLENISEDLAQGRTAVFPSDEERLRLIRERGELVKTFYKERDVFVKKFTEHMRIMPVKRWKSLKPNKHQALTSLRSKDRGHHTELQGDVTQL